MGHESEMPKITYTPSKGLVQEAGTGVSLQSDSVVFQAASLSFTSLPFSPVQAISTAATVTTPGVYTIAGGSPTAVVMPTAASFPGATFVFRAASAQAHFLTGSAETVGSPAFTKTAGASGVAVGSKLTLPAVAGSSVVLVSDGNKYIVSAASGSFTLSETVPA
jgi:hypothetical protein